MTVSVIRLAAVVLGILVSTDAHDPIRTDFSSYIWPTGERRAITSAFGEYRQTHFHAGIDISTRDQTGQPVLAARDGYIERILVSPSGYGRLLAVRHDDGYTTVYAHLSSFNNLLERQAREEQRRLGCFPVDMNLPPGEIHVQQGEVIAYSGDTGTGSAHLHFEIRDGQGRAVNPLLGGNLSIEDSMVPDIREVAFVPLGQGSFVNNGWNPVRARARPTAKGRYKIGDRIRVQGEVGLAVDVRDRSNGSRFLHGVYSILLSIDGREIQSLRFDRVPMDEGHTIGLTYAGETSRSRRDQKLYVDVAHGLEMYSPDSVGSGVIRTDFLTEGAHTFAIVCKDFNGNASTLEGSFLVLRRMPAGGGAPPGTLTGAPLLHLEQGNGFVRVIVENPGSAAGIRAEVIEGHSTRTIPLQSVSPSLQVGTFIPSPDFAGAREVNVRFQRQSKEEVLSESWEILPLIPGISKSFVLDEGNVRVEYGVKAVHSPLYVKYWKEVSGGHILYRFEPGRAVLNKGFTVAVRRTPGDSKEALFTRTSSDWSLLRAVQPDTGLWITGRVRHFLGDIAARRDEEPPSIKRLNIDPRPNRRPLISFRFQDNLAGIEYQQAKLYIDSVMMIPEIDGEHKRVFCMPDSSLERGAHRLSIRLEDKMGNVALFGRTFNVR